jgi:hypothetical protein
MRNARAVRKITNKNLKEEKRIRRGAKVNWDEVNDGECWGIRIAKSEKATVQSAAYQAGKARQVRFRTLWDADSEVKKNGEVYGDLWVQSFPLES